MKNQFFADRRDFFKYDLLLELLDGGELSGLTLVPMLTPDDAGPDGRLTRYRCGNRRAGLYEFLRACLSPQGRRDILELRSFFGDFPWSYMPYRDHAYFEHKTRDEYFAAIPDSALRGALIFLDPDNGLEVASMRPSDGHKYVRWCEARDMVRRMDSSCVLVVYQHLPREKRTAFYSRIGDRIRDELRIPDVVCVSDNEIAFFVLSKVASKAKLTRDLLAAYAHRVGLRLPL